MNAKTKLRNEIFGKLHLRETFDHSPKDDAATRVIREFEAEGHLSITEAGMYEGSMWQIQRLGRW